ncbi:MAG: hypothetical protein HYY17_11185 [Planctomycetes bacterium]|nr:hypothetical protein [Planctomycetota bacterium]
MKNLLRAAIAVVPFLAAPVLAHVPESAPPADAHQIKVGAYIMSLGQFDLATGSYTVDMYLTFRGAKEDLDKLDFEFMNGRGGRDPIKRTDTVAEYRVQASLYEQFDFHHYPFDTQTLTIQLEDKRLGMKELQFTPNKSDAGIDPKIVLTGWKITGWDHAATEQKYTGDDDSFHRFVMTTKLKRAGFSSPLKVFVPLACFLMVMGITLLLRPGSAEGRLTTNTLLLVGAVTYHVTGVMGSLPPLGYITLADWVCIATYVVIGASLLQSVRMFRLAVSDQKDAAMTVYKQSLTLVPLAAAIAYPVAILAGMNL